ncbi:MAG: tRNA-specific adenosine deaminase [Phycisphaerae bacterium]|nr:tRNA-specific adenosine deaminase [Phycisphaerae bacterium]
MNSQPDNPSPVKELFDQLMAVAISEAEQGLAEGGLPIGSALGDRQGRILGQGHNLRVQQGDPMAHAEISCLRNAGRRSNYDQLILASTLMPCCLCAGAAIQFGIGTVVVGESRNFSGERGLMESRGICVVDLNHAGCIEMMASFIARHPQLWNEDIGR